MINERKLSKAELNKREDIIMNMKDNKRDLVKKYGKDAEAVMYGRATNMAKKQTKEMRDPKLTELIKDALKNPKKADLNKDGKLSDYEKTRGAAIEKNIDEAEIPNATINKFSNEIKDAQTLAKAMLGIYDAIQDKEQKDYSKNQKFNRILNYLRDLSNDEVESVKSLSEVSKTHTVKYSKSNDTYQVWLGDEIVTDFATKERADAESKRLNGLQSVKDVDKAQVDEDLDLGHEDNEPGMIKGDLYQIGKASMALYKILDQFDDMGEVDLPSWWQSKIFKAKEAVVGAQEYLDFELNEPKIDAVVDATIDVVDETVEDYITSVDDLTEENITEAMNMNKWRRAYNGKTFAKKEVYLEDYNGNKKRYAIYFKYKETPSKDVVSLSESHFGGHSGSGTAFAMSNLQNKPTYQFTSDDKFEWSSEEEFDAFIAEGPKGLENLLSFFLGGGNVDDAIRSWFDTGVTDKSKLRIGPAEYFPDAAVNESTPKHNSLNENMSDKEYFSFLNNLRDSGKTNMFGATPYLQDAFDLEKKEAREILTRWMKSFSENIAEGLPKGFWDKKIDAKDEDQDGKVDESYDNLVDKIKKSGKSDKAAKAIAGAVASYKAKGGGKGPTAKQK